jgi:hypothetical protein
MKYNKKKNQCVKLVTKQTQQLLNVNHNTFLIASDLQSFTTNIMPI